MAAKWGYHLALDVGKCKGASIRCHTNIYYFAKKLVREIDMKAYGEPQIVRFGVDDKMGYTLVQLIETSNITAHFSEETNAAYIDVFSCKPYDPEIVKQVVNKCFAPETIKAHYFERLA
jgi:S-adenosylmethionine/arginine decarboxylase-like enzyme